MIMIGRSHHAAAHPRKPLAIIIRLVLLLSITTPVFPYRPNQIAKQTEQEKLQRLFEDYWNYVLADSPIFATSIGDHRFDDKLEGVSEEALFRSYDSLRAFQKRAKEINQRRLLPEDRFNLRLLLHDLALELDSPMVSRRTTRTYIPLNQMNGIHLDILQLPTIHSFKTVRDYENYLKRLQAFSKQVDDVIRSMRQGMVGGLVQQKSIVEKVLPQLESGVVADAKKSPLYQAIERMPKEFTKEDTARITASIEREILNTVTPAFRKLLEFVKTEYLPRARAEAGIWSLPRGEARYRYAIKDLTTIDISPDRLHEVGLRGLEEAENEMRKVIERIGFKGSIQEFNQHLRANKQFRYYDAASVEQAYRKALQEIEPKLAQVFSRLPKAGYEIRPIEPYRAASAPPGQYWRPSEDGSRPGIFYYNADRIETEGYGKDNIERLAYHEVAPGHHLQIALVQEIKNLPAFRRHGYHGAYIEGWGIYAETLAKELVGFRDPIGEYGYWASKAIACRGLILDTGLHHKRWTREHAVEFVKKRFASTDHTASRIVDRMIAWPGQILTYETGAIKISELRAKAENELGKNFDIKAFHEVVLNEGALPLDLLTERVESWIAKVKMQVQGK
jgi:uncharacterized protein (DUF885 family)